MELNNYMVRGLPGFPAWRSSDGTPAVRGRQLRRANPDSDSFTIYPIWVLGWKCLDLKLKLHETERRELHLDKADSTRGGGAGHSDIEGIRRGRKAVLPPHAVATTTVLSHGGSGRRRWMAVVLMEGRERAAMAAIERYGRQIARGNRRRHRWCHGRSKNRRKERETRFVKLGIWSERSREDEGRVLIGLNVGP